MQANDTALDFIGAYEYEEAAMPKPEQVRGVLEAALKSDCGLRHKQDPADSLGKGNSYHSLLGIADWLMDHGYDLKEHYDFLKPYIDDEKDAETHGWSDPDLRLEAVQLFEKRVKGEHYDSNDHAQHNRGLFTRMGEKFE